MSAMMAPTLPHAALVPWNVERTSVGNDSAAASHVVQLGPNWLKNDDRKYSVCGGRSCVCARVCV